MKTLEIKVPIYDKGLVPRWGRQLHEWYWILSISGPDGQPGTLLIRWLPLSWHGQNGDWRNHIMYYHSGYWPGRGVMRPKFIYVCPERIRHDG